MSCIKSLSSCKTSQEGRGNEVGWVLPAVSSCSSPQPFPRHRMWCALLGLKHRSDKRRSSAWLGEKGPNECSQPPKPEHSPLPLGLDPRVSLADAVANRAPRCVLTQQLIHVLPPTTLCFFSLSFYHLGASWHFSKNVQSAAVVDAQRVN